MKPELYQFPYSPFCIPIIRVLEAGGVDYDSVEIPQWDRSEIIKLTNGAYYQVPVLKYGSTIVYETGDDTQDVARFVSDTFLGGRLFPASAQGLHEIVLRYLENDVEGVSFRLSDPERIDGIEDLVARTVSIRHKERKFGRGCLEQWRAQKDSIRREVTNLLRPLDSRLTQSRFLFSDDSPVYADFLLYGLIGNILWGGFEEIPAGLDAVARHYADIGSFSFAAKS